MPLAGTDVALAAGFFAGAALAVDFVAEGFVGLGLAPETFDVTLVVAFFAGAAFFVGAALVVPADDFFTAVNSTSLRDLPATSPSAPGHCGTAVPPTSTSG